MNMNKKDFEFEGKKYFVVKPRPEDKRDAQKYYNKGFRKALEDGALLRVGLDKYVREQNIWDDKKQEEFDTKQTKLRDGLNTLKKGKISLSAARDIAIECSECRTFLQGLLSERNQMDENTAESQAEQERLNFLISVCVYNDKGERVYKDYSDFMRRASEDLAGAAGMAFASHLYEYDEDWQLTLPEIQFLHKYKFVNKFDDGYHLINKEGQKVDKEGKLLDISVKTDSGNETDSEPVFLDDDGKEIVIQAELTKVPEKPTEVKSPE